MVKVEEEKSDIDSEEETHDDAEDCPAATPPPMPPMTDLSEKGEVGEDGWLTLCGGKVRKKAITEGEGANPETAQDVRCSVTIREAAYNDSPVNSGAVLQRYVQFRYRLGEGEAVPMLELGLRHMKVGEEAMIYGHTSMAWGSVGLKAANSEECDIPPDIDISMFVVLLEAWEAPAKEKADWNDMIQEVNWRKMNGNDHFKRKNFAKARRCYEHATAVFEDTGFEPPAHVQEKDRPRSRAAAIQIVCDCTANLAGVHLEMGDPAAAKEAAKQVLEYSPEHMKGLYRMAKACVLLDDFDSCEKALENGFRKDPENAALRQIKSELRAKQRRYEERSRKLAGKVFEGLDYPDNRKTAKSKAEEEKEKEDDEEDVVGMARKAWADWFQWDIAVAIVAAVIVFIIALNLTPYKHWHKMFIGFVFLLPLSIGLWLGSKPDDAPKGFGTPKEDQKSEKKKNK